MTQLHYHPAGDSGWLAVADGGRLLLVHPDAGARMDALWPAISEDAQHVLDELTREGIAATPSFALLGWTAEGSLRAIVRGPVRISVSTPSGDVLLDGAAVSTWTEQLVDGATSFEVSVDAASSSLALPLRSGVVFASRVVSVREPAAQAGGAQAPATAQPIQERQAPAPEPVSEATIAESPVIVAASASGAEGEGYDYLFGATLYRTVAAAAVRDPADDAAGDAPAAPGDAAGDHDGMTIMTGDLKKLRGTRSGPQAPPAAADEAPVLYLELSTGGREPLTRPVLVGRAPTATKVSGGALPKLVTIPGDKDISRNHARFTLEGGTVVVTDLHSRNGTLVSLPGKPPQQLRQGEPTSVIVGTVVDLGGGVTLTVCEQD